MHPRMVRRQFLKQTAGFAASAVALPQFLCSSALGRGQVAPAIGL